MSIREEIPLERKNPLREEKRLGREMNRTTPEERVESLPQDVIEWLIQHARNTEWLTHHDKQYCPYCTTDYDSWDSQTRHNDGCIMAEIMRRIAQHQNSPDPHT